jgi:hypothetical protein
VDDVEDSPRALRTRRLRRRHTVVLVSVLSLMILAFGYSAAYYSGWRPSAIAAGQTCTPVAVPAPRPASFVLNVYNGSDRAGLAHNTSKVLARRGYRIGKVANDPAQGVVRAPAEVRYGDKGLDAALLVAGLVSDARLVNDTRTDTRVDLVLGPDFRSLKPAPPLPMPAPGKVTVNVLNTTFRTGLASTVAAEVRTRGFHVAHVGNDPTRVVLGTAEVRYGEDGEPAARLLARQVQDAKMVLLPRTGATVDLVLGNAYTALVPAAQAAAPPPPKGPTPMVTRPGC